MSKFGCAIGEIVLHVLDRAFKADPAAIQALYDCRVSCNQALADDPTVVVGDTETGFDLGFLGLLNGILVEAELSKIAVGTVDGKIVEFQVYHELALAKDKGNCRRRARQANQVRP